jgi:chromosomal replication initiation ATPase DnaA
VGNPLEKLHGQVILGGEEFVNRVKGMFKGKALNQEILERKRLGQHPALDEVGRRISRVFRIDEDRIRGKGSRSNAARKVAIYFSKRYTGLSNEQITST